MKDVFVCITPLSKSRNLGAKKLKHFSGNKSHRNLFAMFNDSVYNESISWEPLYCNVFITHQSLTVSMNVILPNFFDETLLKIFLEQIPMSVYQHSLTYSDNLLGKCWPHFPSIWLSNNIDWNIKLKKM